ncbi:hypothetical protein QBC32DRAFT_195318, partial [Pseudoneurospora amorphoporcata]
MSPPTAAATEDDGTSPSSQAVDTAPIPITTETEIPPNHEAYRPPSIQAGIAGTHAPPEITSASIMSPSVTSSVESDIEELSPTSTGSSTSLTGTEIMTMRRQRIVNVIMQHFCRHLGEKLKDGTAELRRGTQKVAVNPVADRASSSIETLEEQLPSTPAANSLDPVPAWTASGLPRLAGSSDLLNACSAFDNLSDVLSGMPERIYDGSYSFDFDSLWSGDSGVHLPESVSGELFNEGYSRRGLSYHEHLQSSLPLTNYDSTSISWHSQKPEVHNNPTPPRKAIDIHSNPEFITNTLLAVNTMTADFGGSANANNLHDGVQKRAAEDDGDHDGRRKRQRGQANTGRKFACPYFKRNPRKYSKWTCCP